MHCGKMSAPGRQLPVGQIYAARTRDLGTAQTRETQICSPHLLLHARHGLRARATTLMSACCIMALCGAQ